MLPYIFAFILIGHGAAHASGFIASISPRDIGYKTDQPWIFSKKVTIHNSVGKVFGILWLFALAGFIWSSIGLITGAYWWYKPIMPAAIISLVVIIPFWKTVPPGAKFGAVFDLILIIGIATDTIQSIL